MIRRLGWLGLLLGAALAAYLTLAPVPIDPAPWTRTPNVGLRGPYQPNQALTAAAVVPMPAAGPEDVTLGPDGQLYTGLADGRVVRVDRATGAVTTVGNTGGRPLGLRFAASGDLIVADARRGLVAIDSAGSMRVLATSAGGAKLTFTDAVDIAPDGTIWFSDASLRWDIATAGVMDFIESRPTGRLIRYDPATGETRVTLDSIDFANGVAIGPDGAWLLVNETMAGRILRYWLRGPKAGQSEVFVEGLPGFPDNIGYDGRGTFLVSLIGPRTETVERLRTLSPFLRKVIFRIPERLRVSGTDRYGMVVALDTLGAVRYTVQDPSGRFHSTTGAVLAGDTLWVGSLTRPELIRVAIPAAR